VFCRWPPNALAAPTVWAEKSVWVLGCSTPKWDGLVEGTVDEFNGMLPESAPRLVYHCMPQRACQDRRPHPVVGAIIVCSVPAAPFAGMTGVRHDGTTIVDTRVMLNDKLYTNMVCADSRPLRSRPCAQDLRAAQLSAQFRSSET
jgi:hypothetical protein